jgi:hypothetical protein
VRFTRERRAVAHFASPVQYADARKIIRRPSLATVTLDDVDGAWLIDTFHNAVTGGPGYMFGNPPSLPTTR